MGQINVRKRGTVYEYFFEGAKVNNKRTRISKSGFRTKAEAYEYGYRAYEEYHNGGIKRESQMSYADYLDYWMEKYFEIEIKTNIYAKYNPVLLNPLCEVIVCNGDNLHWCKDKNSGLYYIYDRQKKEKNL